MQYFKILAVLVWATTVGPVHAGAMTTYWPGFSGRISQFMMPLDVTKSKDRYLTLKIRFEAKPRAKPVAYSNAFHAVCQRHQGELLKSVKGVSSQNDWRVKVTFQWPMSSSGGVSTGMHEFRFMRLSNCRFI